MQPTRFAVIALLALACTPKIQLEAPKEPIVIHMNIKIEQEVRVRVDRELESLFEEREELFDGAPEPKERS
jgi:hypothetical protein